MKRVSAVFSGGFLFAVAFAMPVEAQLNYYNVAGETVAESPEVKAGVIPNFHIVTPVQNCFDRLGGEQAEEIRKNYTKPYEECLNRLILKNQEEQAAKDAPVKQPEGDGVLHYVRVSGAKDGETSKEKPAEPAAAVPPLSSKTVPKAGID